MYTLLTAQHMEFCSVLRGSLDGSRVWERMDAFMCMTESIRWTPEIVTVLTSPMPQYKIKSLKFKGKMFRMAVEKRLGSSHNGEEGDHGDALRLKEGLWAVWVIPSWWTWVTHRDAVSGPIHRPHGDT